MPATKAQQRAVAKYMAANYAEIKFRVAKGQKGVIQSAAQAAGQSVNAYITQAVETRIAQENRAKAAAPNEDAHTDD